MDNIVTVLRSGSSFEMNGHRFTAKGYVGGQSMSTIAADAESKRKTVERIAACVNGMAELEATNRELVEALEGMLRYADWHARGRAEANDSTECKQALATLKRAKGETE